MLNLKSTQRAKATKKVQLKPYQISIKTPKLYPSAPFLSSLNYPAILFLGIIGAVIGYIVFSFIGLAIGGIMGVGIGFLNLFN